MDLVSLVDPDKNLSEYPDPAGKDGLSGKQEGVNNISTSLTLTPVAIMPSAGRKPGIGWRDDLFLCTSWMLTNSGSPCSTFHEMIFGPVVVQLLPVVGCVIFTPMACPTTAKQRKTGRKYKIGRAHV